MALRYKPFSNTCANVIQEFLIFIIPFVNSGWARSLYDSIKARLKAIMRSGKQVAIPVSETASKLCCYCGKDPVTMYSVGECGHVACYYCLGTAIKRQDNECPLCHSPVSPTMRRWAPAS